jgi:hypothetical protein
VNALVDEGPQSAIRNPNTLLTHDLNNQEMKMHITKWTRALFAATLLCGAGLVHAQGSCPPGYYQVGDPNQGSTGCAPIPGADSESSTPTRKPDQWGAIATYIPKGIIGTSTNQPSKQMAEQAALQDCRAKGGLDCKMESWYSNGCEALVAGIPGFVIEGGNTRDAAIETSMKECTLDGNKGCRALYAACSLP